MNIEAKLAKALAKDSNKLVIRASERDTVLNEISARMARYEKYDPDMFERLKALRKDVKDCFDKGLDPGLELMDQLYFLGPAEREFVERLSRNYAEIITPQDFRLIGTIMSENMAEQVPILKSFTRFFGRLAQDYLLYAKPSDSAWDAEAAIGAKVLGVRKGAPPDVLKRLPGWKPDSVLANILFGIRQKELPKKWTSVPSINFSGKTIEQVFTQTFEEKLVYKDAEGNWITNFVQIPQKTDPTFWEEITNKSGKINDIADVTQARTGYGVSMNHSNDATLVKEFHLWGRQLGVATSTIHDAFFANAADMLAGRNALRQIYANTLDKNVVKDTLDEMRRRGLPKRVYEQYLQEAIELGIIPVSGKSKVGGKLMQDSDILQKSDVLAPIPEGFESDLGFYGVG